MLGIAILISVVSFLLIWTWQFLNWAWLKPRKIEKLLRKQGMNGNPYKFLFGDSKDTARMYEEGSKSIGIHEDPTPRLMPNVVQAVQKYGDICFVWIGTRPRILIMDPAAARDALNKYRRYTKSFKVGNEIIRMVTTGLVFFEGDEWSNTRAKLNPSFHVDKLKPMAPSIQSSCDIVLNEWRELVAKNGGSNEIDVYYSQRIFTSQILSQLMFSSPYTEATKRTFLQITELSLLAEVHSNIPIPGGKYLPTKTNRKAKELNHEIRATLTSMIYDRLEKRKAGGKSFNDLLDVFMEELYEGNATKKKDHKRIIEYVIGQCKIFFFAGFEGTSNLLTWVLVLLSVDQDCQARARQEVLDILGDKKDINSDDVAKLKFMTCILNEVLRLYPPVMELSRYVEKDSKIKDYFIPEGSLVSFPVILYQRNKEIWGDDADEFRPERFADGVAKATKGESGAFMPFGWGPRICIGMNFAMIESKILLSLILREFSFKLSPSYKHAPISAFTVHPQYGAPLILTKI